MTSNLSLFSFVACAFGATSKTPLLDLTSYLCFLLIPSRFERIVVKIEGENLFYLSVF